MTWSSKAMSTAFAAPAELAGDLDVRRTRRRVAAGVVVLCCAPSYVE